MIFHVNHQLTEPHPVLKEKSLWQSWMVERPLEFATWCSAGPLKARRAGMILCLHVVLTYVWDTGILGGRSCLERGNGLLRHLQLLGFYSCVPSKVLATYSLCGSMADCWNCRNHVYIIPGKAVTKLSACWLSADVNIDMGCYHSMIINESFVDTDWCEAPRDVLPHREFCARNIGLLICL